MGDQEDLSTRFAPIDISTTDYGALLQALGLLEIAERRWRGSFKMPRIVFPVQGAGSDGNPWGLAETATSRNLRVALFAGASSLTVTNANNDAISTSGSFLWVNGVQYYFNGTTFDRARHASTVTSVSAVAAGTTTILAAGGVAKKTRIYAMALSLAAGSTASRAVITDGTIMCSVEAGLAATPLVADSVSISCGPDGVPQSTANAAISITVTGTGAVGAATVVSGLAE